jgi:iron complex outermembrane receptor protein
MWAVPLAAQEQTGTVSGRVVDQATQQPLARAYVSVGVRGVLTGPDGRYTLTAAPGTEMARARMIGYAPAERPVTVVAGQTITLDFALAAQAVGLSEIVVTGYGEQRAGDITGAVTQVSSEQFNTGRIVSPTQLITAKVPGVQVVDNNEPGGGLSVRVRGPSSVTASSEPLYVVDGIPVGTGSGGGMSAGRDPLNFLNPDDIESITVLRDASAAAIYGSNAANGVVIIKTKSGAGVPGAARRMAFEYSTSFSASQTTRLPEVLNAAEFDSLVTIYAPQNAGQLLNANTDWLDVVTRTGYGQDHNLSVTSTGENTNLRMSVGYLSQEGILLGTTVERVSLGLNIRQQLFDDRLDLRLNLRGARTDDHFTDGAVLSMATQMGPTQPVYDSTTVTGYYDWPGQTLTSADNPLAIAELTLNRGRTYRSFGSLQADYRVPFVEGLRANLNLGFDVTSVRSQYFAPSTLHRQIVGPDKGVDYRSNPSGSNGVFEGYLNYAPQSLVLAGYLDVTAGYSYSQSHEEFPWYRGSGLFTNVLQGNAVVTAATVQNSQWVQDWKTISFFGRVNYNYGDRFLVGATLRRDASSRFGPNNQWATFPSVSLGWRLSQEGFMRGMESVSDLKLRLAWAQTGNQNIGNYLFTSTYTFGDAQTQAQFGNVFVPTIRPSAADENIKWEEIEAYNVGLDFGLWSQRLTGTLDWYRKNTSDMLFYIPIAAGTNLANYVTTNIGSMRNTGVELSLSARLREGRNGRLGWTADFTAAYNSNTMTRVNPLYSARVRTGNIGGGVGNTIQVLTAGYPVNSFYVWEQVYDTVSGSPTYGRPLEGVYVDQFTVLDSTCTPTDPDCRGLMRRDGQINQDDLIPYHSPNPKWIFGHTSYLTYGRWSLNFTLRAQLGAYVYNNFSSTRGFFDELTRASPYNLSRSVLETDFNSQQYLSSYYVESANFLRMDNITLAYSFDFRGLPWRAFASVQNVFTLTGYSGVDPTAGVNGIDLTNYPRSRTWSGGLSVRF